MSDVRVGAWSPIATAGTSITFEAVFPAGYDISGGVSAYVGGTITDPEDFTGATQFAASIVGQVATFTVDVDADLTGSTPFRTAVAGALLSIGKLHVRRTGTEAPNGTITVVTEPVTIELTVLGVGPIEGGGGGGGAVDSVNGQTGVVVITAAGLGAATTGALAAEAALARNADNLTSGTVADARIAGTIARDSEVAAAQAAAEATAAADATSKVAAHSSDTTGVHGFADAAVVETKVGHLTVTQPVDLDTIEARVNSLDAAVVLRGEWDASAGTFPGGGTAQAGDSYIVSVAGTVNGVAFSVGDRVVAILDNASTTTYASNWLKLDYTDQVLSVDGRVGAVTLSDLYDAAGAAAAAQAAAVQRANHTGSQAISTVTGLQTALDDKAPLASPSGSGEAVWPSFRATGKTGATATPLILGGGTTSGAPTTGAHVVGELVVDDAGNIYRCTVAGTPGTWVDRYDQVVTDAVAALPSLEDGTELTFTLGGSPPSETLTPVISPSRFKRLLAIRTTGPSLTASSSAVSLLDSTVIPAANSIAVGDTLTFHMAGSVLNNVGTDQTLTLRLRCGAGNLFAGGALTLPSSAIARAWFWDVECAVTATSGGQLFGVQGNLIVSGVVATDNVPHIHRTFTGTDTVVDLTDWSADAFDLTGQHNTTSGSMTTICAIFEIIHTKGP